MFYILRPLSENMGNVRSPLANQIAQGRSQNLKQVPQNLMKVLTLMTSHCDPR